MMEKLRYVVHRKPSLPEDEGQMRVIGVYRTLDEATDAIAEQTRGDFFKREEFTVTAGSAM